jgi:hypothetical protein
MLTVNSEGIKVKGHIGTWYVIEEVFYGGKQYFLLEHETYGNDALWVAVNTAGDLVMDDISDGAGELIEFLADQMS